MVNKPSVLEPLKICCTCTYNKQYYSELGTVYLKRKHHSIIAFSYNSGQLLKERICSSRSKFFLLRVDPCQRAASFREANRNACKLIKQRRSGGRVAFIRVGAKNRINMVN